MKTRGSLLTLALLMAGSARANTFETFGFGPRAASMAGALTADAKDYTAVFYNPAMLVLPKQLNFGFAFAWHRAATTVETVDRARELDCGYCAPPDSVGTNIGLLFPLAGKVQNRLALGLGLYLPAERLLRTKAPDPNRPFWYLFETNPERMVVFTGAGVRLTDSLSLGIGVQALADLVGQGAAVRVDLFSKEVRLREIDSHLSTRLGPVAGLYFSPTPSLRLGATYRAEMALLFQIPARVDLDGVGTLGFTVEGLTHYSPHTVNLGVAFDVTEQLTFTLDGQWMNWSAAPSPYIDLTVDLSGDTLRALGLEEALDINSTHTSPGFADTLGGRMGVEYRLNERFAVRGGAFYRPTPVPKQDAPGTNILDGSTVGGAVGLGYAFDDPTEIFQHPVKIDLSAEGALLLPREAIKESTDVVPSYRYSARSYGVGAAVRYDF